MFTLQWSRNVFLPWISIIYAIYLWNCNFSRKSRKVFCSRKEEKMLFLSTSMNIECFLKSSNSSSSSFLFSRHPQIMEYFAKIEPIAAYSLHTCIPAASLLHLCCISAASLLHICCTSAAHLLHFCCFLNLSTCSGIKDSSLSLFLFYL